jgi:hypothetical protein
VRHLSALALLSMITRTSAVAQADRCGGGTARYLMTARGDTVAAESVALDSTTIQSQLEILKAGVRRHHGVAFGPGIETRSAYVKVWPAGAVQTGPPTQQAVVKFTGTAAQTVVTQGTQSQIQLDAVESGTLPFMSGSVLYLQLISMRAAAVARDTVRVPLVWLFSGGQLDTAYVSSRGRDSVSIETGVGS